MTVDWLDRIRDRGRFSSREDAEHAANATLEVLGAGLVTDEIQALEHELPPQAARVLERVHYEGDLSLDDLYERVAALLCVRPGLAMEQVQVVCAVLAEQLSPPLRQRLQKHLPRLSELFEATGSRPPPEGPEVLREPPPKHNNLAEGRPGSRHPVSEARPDRAHQHSVARSDDPHAETKLSSARGLTQEREGETLATGKPDAKRKMSDA